MACSPCGLGPVSKRRSGCDFEGYIRFTDHALSQMNRRLLFKKDVIQIAQTCTRFEWQADKKTYLLVGCAENGKGAAFSCVYQEGVVVVTVMWRHLGKKERRSG